MNKNSSSLSPPPPPRCLVVDVTDTSLTPHVPATPGEEKARGWGYTVTHVTNSILHVDMPKAPAIMAPHDTCSRLYMFVLVVYVTHR